MDERLARGIRLFNEGEFFHCHEVLEDAWRLERGRRRLFLQALIHAAVGFYHDQRGNPVGAAGQLRKASEKLAAYLPSCDGVDTAQLYRSVIAATEALQAGRQLSKYPRIHACLDTVPTQQHSLAEE
jgi:predicted metal-dependent hydrolase